MASSDLLSVQDYLNWPTVEADERLYYGEGEQQFGDLYLPQQASESPLVILIHGGCWRAQYGLDPLSGLCDALRQTGLAVWSLEYRRLGNGGGWPTTFLDVAAGADFVKTLASSFPLDLKRVVAMGHSAGGHLALWLAGREHLPAHSELYRANPIPLRGVVALAGIPDLAAAERWQICGEASQELIGGPPEQYPERYQQGSPVDLLPLRIPQRHLVGAHDEIVPPAYLEAQVALAQQHGDATLEILPHIGHFEIVAPHGGPWAKVRTTLWDLLMP